MKTKDAVFTTHAMTIQLPKLATEFTLKPFGDVHRHSPACDVDRWHGFLDWCKDDDEHTYYLSLGDLDDIVSASERTVFSDRKIHESTRSVMDDFAEAQTNKLIDELSFMKGRMLGCMQGNHYWEFDSGDTSTSRICKALDAKWLGTLAYIRLRFRFGKRGARHNVDIVACHGKAGGQLVGTSLNQVDKLKKIFPAADIYIMGHDHKKGAWPTSALVANHSGKCCDGTVVIRQKRQWLCRAGSFLRGYVDGESSYVTNRLYAPSDLGVVRFDITFKNTSHQDKALGKEHNVIRPDIHAWA